MKVSGLYILITLPLFVSESCGLFLCVPVYLRLLHTKFHRLQMKTFCLRACKKDRMGSLQYTYCKYLREYYENTMDARKNAVFTYK